VPKWSIDAGALCHYGPEVAEKCQLRVAMAERRKLIVPFR